MNNTLAIMKKYYSILGALLLMAGCAKQEVNPAETPENPTPGKGGVTFVAGFNTKVATDAGVSTWRAEDNPSERTSHTSHSTKARQHRLPPSMEKSRLRTSTMRITRFLPSIRPI